jgi:hypothetical protein
MVMEELYLQYSLLIPGSVQRLNAVAHRLNGVGSLLIGANPARALLLGGEQLGDIF